MLKRVLCVLLAATLLLSMTAFGADLGVQLISGPEEEEDVEPVSLDDVKLGKEMEIDNYGIVIFNSFDFGNSIGRYGMGGHFDSGVEAEYGILKIDITNTSKQPKDFLQNISVKVVYDDEYEYSGFAYQYDYNKSKESILYSSNSSNNYFAIDPMYIGHYLFGCTLPNTVVESKKPLRMEISIDENDFTYHIRK